jgi:hypothetical protein
VSALGRGRIERKLPMSRRRRKRPLLWWERGVSATTVEEGDEKANCPVNS